MSDSNVPTECSTPRPSMCEETDRQILKWAGKLELESIDLRDKSSRLFQMLETNSRLLKSSHEKVALATAGLGDLKELQEQVKQVSQHLETFAKAQTANEASVKTFYQNLGDLSTKNVALRSSEIERIALNNEDRIDQIMHRFNNQAHATLAEQSAQNVACNVRAESAFTNLLGQTVAASQVLKSVSAETARNSDRMVALEEQVGILKGSISALCEFKKEVTGVEELKDEMKTLKELKSDIASLRKSTQGLDVLSSFKAEVEELRSLKTDADAVLNLRMEISALRKLIVTTLREKEHKPQELMSKLSPKSIHKVSKPVSRQLPKRTQTTAGTRWIIPWDEVSDNDSATLMSSEL
ncbi:Rec107p LALA0_S06e01156g [Lachancea lanzarotensis]|uniref:LALA0S06e01156g1_1 n=1 Tax=Lachancea lanzarotensis TaxID=1245769 RepID=A0A0C7N7Z4_9SACH|nr:uncharacterized protein LALA0_S06e01156g [Lachancea lanzarotensis]CEP62678.1 LALA0S06e01156g1_1 [Lachancea lanzarotensis]